MKYASVMFGKLQKTKYDSNQNRKCFKFLVVCLCTYLVEFESYLNMQFVVEQKKKKLFKLHCFYSLKSYQ